MEDRSDEATTSPLATVAVVSWNTRELLRLCLDSLQPEHEAGRAEVWVVDNASTDGSAEMVRTEFPWVNLKASEENLGFGPAVNAVARESTAPWLVPANADIELAPGSLNSLIDASERTARTGMVAPRLLLPNGETQHSVHPFPTLRATLLTNLGIERLSPRLADRLCTVGHWNPDRRRRVDWAHGACLLVRREAFDAIGGFDPDQWMYAEDLDLAWRLRRAGWATRYEPTAEVHHAVSAATAKAWGEERNSRSMAATYAWVARRRSLTTARAVAAANIAGAASRVAWHGALARLTSSPRHRHDRERWRWHLRLHLLGLRAREERPRAP